MTVQELCNHLELLAPLRYQESYDNCGLLCGDRGMDVPSALLCLDCTEEVLDEAIALGCKMVISHHPLVFSALKKFTAESYVERILLKAIKQDIALYACHTNLDNMLKGVNAKLAQKLGLQHCSILQPKSGHLKKLVTFVPSSHLEQVQQAVFEAGAGRIGNYDSCSFAQDGTGTFRGNEQSKPFVGKAGTLSKEKEVRVEFIFEAHLESDVLKAMQGEHPYEEPAFDIYTLDNRHPGIGSGMIGELESPMSEREFLEKVKGQLNAKVLRHTKLISKPIKTVAICGGSGRFLLQAAVRGQADAFLTADFKYHDFFDVDGRLLLIDPGHFETEQFTPEIIYEWFQNKFPKFAIRLSKRNTNPIQYF